MFSGRKKYIHINIYNLQFNNWSKQNKGLDLQLPVQSVPITTKIMSSNPTQVIQQYAIKFISDLQQVGGFLWVFGFLHQ
jgi:hypothetical protein